MQSADSVSMYGIYAQVLAVKLLAVSKTLTMSASIGCWHCSLAYVLSAIVVTQREKDLEQKVQLMTYSNNRLSKKSLGGSAFMVIESRSNSSAHGTAFQLCLTFDKAQPLYNILTALVHHTRSVHVCSTIIHCFCEE